MCASPCRDTLKHPSSRSNAKPPKKTRYPHRWNHPICNGKTYYDDTDTAELLDAHSTLYVQKVCGDFLYYAIAVDQTMLLALNTISTARAHATTTNVGDVVWLLIYTETHLNATIHYHASNIILHIASDVSYLCEEHAHSRAKGHFSLADKLVKNGNKLPTLPTNNRAIHTLF